MPWKTTMELAARDRREGKAPTTQAGEFVREEIEHVRRGKHGARSTKQAIAIGLSKARRAGVPLPPPKKGTVSERTRRNAERDRDASGRGGAGASAKHASPKRSRAVEAALKREGHAAASKPALAKQARSAARRRTASERSAAARKGARTKGAAARSAAARKAARTRARKRTA